MLKCFTRLLVLVFSILFYTVSSAQPPASGSPNLYTIRIKLNNPSYATYSHAENPYNKSLVSIFQVDDSPKTIYNLMYPYLKGGTTAGGYVSQGVKSTDGTGNNLFWTISGACFVQDNNGNDLLSGNPTYISWSELATVTATGTGFQRGFDFTNHAFGGSEVLQKDRYKQIQLNNQAAFDHLGFQPEGLVVPDVQIGYRFGANDMGMDVTSQAGPEPLKDGKNPLSESASAQEIYAAVQSPYFLRRNHWQEVNDPSLVNEHKSYILAAYNKSQVKPGIYNWFSHGPGEAGSSNFAYYRQVIDYMKSLAGDKVIGLSLDQYLGYQKARYAAEHGTGKSSALTQDGYLDITFDMADLKSTVRHRLLSLLVNSNASIESVTWSNNIKAVSFNSATGLVNIQLDEITSVDPATLPVRPTIIAGSPKITAANPNRITFQLDRAISQTIASAYEVAGNTVTGISEVSGSGGLNWTIQLANNFLSTDVVALTYKAEIGNALDLNNGKKMLTYGNLPVLNQSQETPPEEQPLAISIRRDSDNMQLATFNTIAEVKTYMATFNFNTNISIVLNNSATYALPAKWTLGYNNTSYTLTIKGKDGLETYPLIDAGGLTSDPLRVAMSHVRIKQLKIRSGKYTGDGTQFGDNYSGALISQEANTSDCQYTYLELFQGMRGIRIGASNGTASPNISGILIDHVKLTELTGIAIQVGIQSGVGGEPESRTDASYKLNNVMISNIQLRDTKNQQTIETSGAKYYGQILCRGINNLTLKNIDSDQNQKQPVYIASCKNVLIDKFKATAFSLNTGTGYKAAIHFESSELITIQNCFVQAPLESLYIAESTGIKLYHNTFDVQQTNLHAVVMPTVRLVLDIQGNLILTKGDAAGRSPIIISFYRGAGYIPTIATDFASEKNNVFGTASFVFEFLNLGTGNTNLTVSNSATTFADYKTTYSRGQNSLVTLPSTVVFEDIGGVHGYLATTSAGREFVTTQIAGISTDLANNPRPLPTDAGAYTRRGLISPNISTLVTSAGTFQPSFAPTVLNYAVAVPHLTSTITFTPTLTDALATMQVKSNGGAYASLASDSTSAQYSLNVGQNTIEVKVTSSDGVTINSYVTTVTRSSESFSITGISNSTIAENTVFTGSVPTITGIPYGELSYTLTGADALLFTINTSTGQVSMVARNYESPADANHDNAYELTIVATDADGKSASKAFNVSVTDVIEHSVFTIDPVANVSLVENYAYTGGVPAITGTTIGKVTYTVAGLDASDFTIDSLTGVVQMVARSFAQPADANADNTYELTLKATDEDGNTTSRSYTVKITKFNPFPYTETFKNSTASGLVFGGNPIPASLTSGNIDANGSGFLRLTSNANNQTAFARNITSFPSDEGMSISFDYYTYGGSGADGLSFFLYDATASPFVIGGFGGSLGYAQNNTQPGVSKAFLGFGIDEFGNFSNPTAARQGGPGERSSSVTLRGDGNGINGPLNYEYLTSIQTSDAASMGAAGAGNAFQIAGGVDGRTADGLNPLTAGYRRAKLNLKPNGLGTGYKIDVWITEGDASGGTVHHVVKNYTYIPSSAIPALLNYGFSAGTGGKNNYHEIRNLEINLPEDIVSAPLVTNIAKTGVENGSISFASEDFNSKFNPNGGGALSKIKVVSLPAHGTLKLDLALVSPGQEIPVSSLALLNFVPANDYNGADSFQWNGSDGNSYAISGAFVNLSITAAPIFPYSESFKDPLAAGMIYGGTPSSALLTAGNVDANGAGYLRLTTNATNQKGFARSTKSFPTANGLSISFDYYTYGGNGADGISFFLYDSSVNPFVIGGFGGSLGYAQNAGAPGISKAYLGLGLDEFGNFSNPTAGRQGGPGQRPSSVTLRGDGEGSTAIPSNYEYLTSMQTSNLGAMNASGAGTAFQVAGGVNGRTAGADGLSFLNTGYRKAKMELRPNSTNTGFIINVWITEGSASAEFIHPVISNYSYVGATMPSKLSFGFTGSTGGSTNFHEIRNLSITLPESIEAKTLMSTLQTDRRVTAYASPLKGDLVDESEAIIPTNLLSPNGDGKNDTWIVRNIHLFPKNSVRVFNKKGQEVYTKNSYLNEWDGKFNGVELAEDTYYYIIDFGNDRPQMKGYISIVR